MRAFLLACAVLLLAATEASAAAGSRIALLIGNGAYAHLNPLNNPPRDVADVASVLRTAGFSVEVATDLDDDAMKAAVDRFGKQAEAADVALFYYAGHGLQVASENFLVPVDADLRSEQDVYDRTVPLQGIMDKLAHGNGARLVFIDACRKNPLPGGGRQQGLARVGTAKGFFISFATAPGEIALDGGGRNSPFARALLAHMPTQGEDISTMLIDVRKDVIAATGGLQVPWDWSSLTQKVTLVPGAPDAVPPETRLWQLAASGPDRDLLDIYLSRYPNGRYVDDARELKGAPKAEPSSGRRTGSVGDVTQVEETLWSLARTQRLRALVEVYLARYPEGRHGAAARELLAGLPADGGTEDTQEASCEKLATHPNDATALLPGTSIDDLQRNAKAAVVACEAAVQAFPDNAHYVALLARATVAAGDGRQAASLYTAAAERGDARAMVSLGRLYEVGKDVKQNLAEATRLYEQAAARGMPDGQINLAVNLFNGTGAPRDVPRALELLRTAAASGSALATLNLGTLYDKGVASPRAQALELFEKAAELGEPRGYVMAATLLDEGRGVAKDPVRAADLLLRAVALDYRDVLRELVQRTSTWSPDTVKAVQATLRDSGYYAGPVDGRDIGQLANALKLWRLLGPKS